MLSGLATFVVDVDNQVVSGIAAKGVWGSGRGAKEMEGTSKETAEAWFDRIGGL